MPVRTMGQALGIKDGVLELNTAASARCPVCGKEGTRRELTTATGLMVIVYVPPLGHACKGARVQKHWAEEADE